MHQKEVVTIYQGFLVKWTVVVVVVIAIIETRMIKIKECYKRNLYHCTAEMKSLRRNGNLE